MLSLYEKLKFIRWGHNVQQQQKSSLALHPQLKESEEGEGRRRRRRREEEEQEEEQEAKDDGGHLLLLEILTCFLNTKWC
jgi:hypothetical protein